LFYKLNKIKKIQFLKIVFSEAWETSSSEVDKRLGRQGKEEALILTLLVK